MDDGLNVCDHRGSRLHRSGGNCRAGESPLLLGMGIRIATVTGSTFHFNAGGCCDTLLCIYYRIRVGILVSWNPITSTNPIFAFGRAVERHGAIIKFGIRCSLFGLINRPRRLAPAGGKRGDLPLAAAQALHVDR